MEVLAEAVDRQALQPKARVTELDDGSDAHRARVYRRRTRGLSACCVGASAVSASARTRRLLRRRLVGGAVHRGGRMSNSRRPRRRRSNPPRRCPVLPARDAGPRPARASAERACRSRRRRRRPPRWASGPARSAATAVSSAAFTPICWPPARPGSRSSRSSPGAGRASSCRWRRPAGSGFVRVERAPAVRPSPAPGSAGVARGARFGAWLIGLVARSLVGHRQVLPGVAGNCPSDRSVAPSTGSAATKLILVDGYVASEKPNSLPPLRRRCAHIRPPIASTSWRETNSPMPAPAAVAAVVGER